MIFKSKLTAGVLLVSTALSTSFAQAQYGQYVQGRYGRPATQGAVRPAGPATPDYFGSMWGSLSPEQKFGAFVEAFWAFASVSAGSVNCRPDEPSQRACLARQGYTFQASYPGDCKVSFAEQIPMPTNVQKTWDGQVTGVYQIGHALTIDLHSLNRGLINNSLKLYFDESTPANVRVDVKLSSNPNEWQTIPNPPTLKDVPPGQNEKDRARAFMQLRQQWGHGVTQKYGSGGSLPYFSHFFPNAEVLNPPPELTDSNKVFYVLSPPNRMQPVGLFSPDSAGNADALFVEALKSVIAKCPQQ